jgi:nicotinate phosphoribosyltransferase
MRKAEQKIAEGILFTDLYQLTMAQLYWRLGLGACYAQFDHFFRSYPDYGQHKAGYCIQAGLQWFVDWMQEVRFETEDLEYLKNLAGSEGQRLFQDDFLDWLKERPLFEHITLRSIPEGRTVYPDLPLTVVQGPLPMAQILESALLNQMNYQTLVATKAARLDEAGRGKLMIEFGMRRGHGTGVNAGARAALIGGAEFTSNTGVSCVMGLPPKGTHAHSMVQVFMAMGKGEEEAFQAYADLYPDDCVLLVDTINTLESGVPNAIKVFERLRQRGHQPTGIRLDSGDLAFLSIQSARMLNQAGFEEAKIVLSNELDELNLWQIISQIEKEAPGYGIDPDHLVNRLVYGVGTRLITSHGDPSLDGVYKLVAVQDGGNWTPALKLSETPAKVLNPGDKRAWRIYDERGSATADILTLEDEDPRQMDAVFLQHPSEPNMNRTISRENISAIEPLLVDIVRDGEAVYEFPALEQIRQQRRSDLSKLDPGVRRLMNPHTYHVSLSGRLWDLKHKMILKAKGSAEPQE